MQIENTVASSALPLFLLLGSECSCIIGTIGAISPGFASQLLYSVFFALRYRIATESDRGVPGDGNVWNVINKRIVLFAVTFAGDIVIHFIKMDMDTNFCFVNTCGPGCVRMLSGKQYIRFWT